MFNQNNPPVHDGRHTALFQSAGHINIPQAFDTDFAQAMATGLESHRHYKMAAFINNQVLNLSASQWQALSSQQRSEIQKLMHNNAAQGIGYCYGRSTLADAGAQTAVFKQFSEWLNGPQVLDWVKQLSGHTDICAASLQASCFEPGHFLTRHNDVHATEERRVAYVANFSRAWHPDWGGLLQFYSNHGQPQESWAPFFNSLNLFDVTRVHSVTYVTPFAQQSRYAFSGWFRATAL
ncbi:2OG-Fe(II) oxygenase [Salinimonas marina]|uniref:2OG-Fe(II) oxygenase n=1 Tax=Salinimonas marina TaxID=2785918 RepID=A0A7S9DVU4_9ALTE|nr:2OG-Fe(II) oxygenase family protein [Salinimonas marina]QPG04886.1 2OG-Fe(II) oxygenase [Salinimonas marina]